MGHSSPRRAIVLGVTGQDGSYLAERLLARGYAVVGVGRQSLPAEISTSGLFSYQTCDLRQPAEVMSLLERVRPGAIFHVAAVHGSSGFDYEAVWADVMPVNTGSAQAALEYLRRYDPAASFVYASSAKVFGAVMPRRVSGRSRRKSTCLYSISKNATHDLVTYYRQRHGLKASTTILFNHESPRRPGSYMVRSLVSAVAGALTGQAAELTQVSTLDFYCDWGSADEYMDLSVDLAELEMGHDVVMATGNTWYGRRFAKALFGRYGLKWSDYIEERSARAATVPQRFTVNVLETERLLGRRPQRSIFDVCDEILRVHHNQAWAAFLGVPCGSR